MSFIKVSLYSLAIPLSVSPALANSTVDLPHGRQIEPSTYGTISTKECKVVYKFIEMLKPKSSTCRVLKFKDLSDFCEKATRTFCTSAQRTALKILHNLLNSKLNFEIANERKSSIIEGIYDNSGKPIQDLRSLKRQKFRIVLSKPFMFYIGSGKKVELDTRVIDSFQGYQSSATINLYSYLTWFSEWGHPRLNIKVNNLLSKMGRLELLDSKLHLRLQAIKHHVTVLNDSLKNLGYLHQYQVTVYKPSLKSRKVTENSQRNPVVRITEVALRKRRPLPTFQHACGDFDETDESAFIETYQDKVDKENEQVYEKPLSYVTKLRKAFQNGVKKVSASCGFQQRDLQSMWSKPATEP